MAGGGSCEELLTSLHVGGGVTWVLSVASHPTEYLKFVYFSVCIFYLKRKNVNPLSSITLMFLHFCPPNLSSPILLDTSHPLGVFSFLPLSFHHPNLIILSPLPDNITSFLQNSPHHLLASLIDFSSFHTEARS